MNQIPNPQPSVLMKQRKTDCKVSLFIPTYNAARYINKTLKKSCETLSRLSHEFEIMIVDDNSKDQSHRFERVINKAAYADGRFVRFLSHQNGPSRRENLACSFTLAKNDVICFIDVDLSCDISYLAKAIALLNDESADIVIGSRYIRGARVKRRLLRRVLSFFYNRTVRLLFDSKIMDHQCGLKVFRKSTAMPIIEQMGYDHAFVRGWFWDAEFLVRAQKAKLKIIEMPLEWRYAKTSTFNLLREWKCLRAIMELKKELG